MERSRKNENTDVKHTPARKSDAADESIANRPTNTTKASKLANLLEGMKFPATKKEILAHLRAGSSSGRPGTDDIESSVQQYLKDNETYASTYDVELAVGLVRMHGDNKGEPPYARDTALNRANSRRTGERIRRDPYTEHESVGVASSKDVSPNTPKGESV
jgi:hypothetical protein